MITISQTQESLLIDCEHATIPYSTKTLKMNQVIRRHPQPLSVLKQGKFRKLFNRHRPILGYR